MKISKTLPTFIGQGICESVTHALYPFKHMDKFSARYCHETEQLEKFHNAIKDPQGRETSGFFTIFDDADSRLKVNTQNALACVVSTGFIKSIIKDYVMAMQQYRQDNPKDIHANNTPIGGLAPHVLRLLDVVRYISEIDADAIEFSLKNANQHPHTKGHRQLAFGDVVFLSDRYQKDSWKQHLNTDYPNYDTSAGELLPLGVATAEYNSL